MYPVWRINIRCAFPNDIDTPHRLHLPFYFTGYTEQNKTSRGDFITITNSR